MYKKTNSHEFDFCQVNEISKIKKHASTYLAAIFIFFPNLLKMGRKSLKDLMTSK